MKIALALAVVLAAAAVDSAVLQATPRTGLTLGFNRPGDELLFSAIVSRDAELNTVQIESVSYQGNDTTIISHIEISELTADRASVWVTEGGLGRSSVTAKFHAYQGQGYNYLFEVWGQ